MVTVPDEYESQKSLHKQRHKTEGTTKQQTNYQKQTHIWTYTNFNFTGLVFVRFHVRFNSTPHEWVVVAILDKMKTSFRELFVAVVVCSSVTCTNWISKKRKLWNIIIYYSIINVTFCRRGIFPSCTRKHHKHPQTIWELY